MTILPKRDSKVNEHFQAAQKQAENLPFIHTRAVKRQQQQGILRSLLAGLKVRS